MKGLFIKDLKLLKNQKSFILIFAAVIVIYLFTDITAMAAIGYATFVGTMFVMSTISYDEYDNGNAFLFTLPFSRKSYVREKYLFALVTGGVSWLVSTIVSVICDSVRDDTMIISDYISSSLFIAAVFFIIISIILPVQLKFGGNRGTIAMFLSVCIASLIIYIAAQGLNFFDIDILAMFDALQSVSLLAFSLISLAIAAVCFMISMRISIKIIEKKEF